MAIAESLSEQIRLLRDDLVAHRSALINHSNDRETALGAIYSVLYDGVPESDADRIHGMVAGQNVPGSRDQVRPLIRTWMGQ